MGQLFLLVLHLFLSDVEACAVFTSHGAAVKLSWQVPVPSGVCGSCIAVVLGNLCPALPGQ